MYSLSRTAAPPCAHKFSTLRLTSYPASLRIFSSAIWIAPWSKPKMFGTISNTITLKPTLTAHLATINMCSILMSASPLCIPKMLTAVHVVPTMSTSDGSTLSADKASKSPNCFIWGNNLDAWSTHHGSISLPAMNSKPSAIHPMVEPSMP